MNIRGSCFVGRGFFLLLVFLFPCAGVFAVGQRAQGGDVLPVRDGAEHSEPGPYPLEVEDDTGYIVRLERRPRRIVSLTVFTDDILLELVDHGRLIGITSYSEDPAISNVLDRIEDIPHKLTLNVEVVLSVQPDLVFVADWHEADKVTQMRDAGVPVYLIATAMNIPAIEEKITTIAALVDAEDEGRAMIGEMNRRLSEVDRRTAAIAAGKRLTVMDYALWGSAQGTGSSWDVVIRRAGLINAVGEFSSDQWGQVPLSKEKILELDPDLLILPGWVYGDPGGADAFFRQTVEDPALQGLTAIREHRVYQMPEGLKAATSQYIVAAVEYLARLAYPQLFPE